MYFTRLFVIFASRKILSLENKNKRDLFCILLAYSYFCGQKIKETIMEAVVNRTPGRVTVSMSTRRWNRMLQLEEAYKLGRIIKRSMKQVEMEPSMTPEEAIEQLRSL